jgi:D-alanyl-lipoteichoic acid acyltransferase DltB (MBOAT superfamily)
MIFSSFEFIFVFLPIVLAGYWLASIFKGTALSKLWLVAASLIFYGYWDWNYIFLIAGSIIGNFALARFQLSCEDKKLKRIILIVAILGNLGLLSYFKYLNFFFENIAFITGGYQIEKIILPIGLSFYTFQQISYQVDAFNGRSPVYNFLDYSLFVAFFPQLIAGPIVHHTEMLPQFAKKTLNSHKARNLLLGLCVFSVGLFKKSVFADTFATYADPVFNGAHAGTIALSAADAWQGVTAYGLQLYFDFSGYSDMAVGLGIMFGISLPFNFFSPLKAHNMIEFWRRWHISLTREINNLIYNPVSMSSTRYVINKRMGKLSSYFVAVALPTLFIWLIVGTWHGAGWTFILMGLAFGFCIAVNHFAKQFVYSRKKNAFVQLLLKVPNPFWVFCNFIAYLLIMVLFRSESMDTAKFIYSAMFDFDAPTVRRGVYSKMLNVEYIWFIAGLFTIWFLPNTIENFSRYRIGIDIFGWKRVREKGVGTFRFNYASVIFCAFLAMMGLIFIAQSTAEFIYFDF